MPSKQVHIQQAVHNQQLCGVLDNAHYPDWCVTVMFYCALHYVDAILAESLTGQVQHPQSHEYRNKGIGMLQVFTPQIHADYRALQTRSRMARYDHWRGSKNKQKFSKSALKQLEQDTFSPLVEKLKALLT